MTRLAQDRDTHLTRDEIAKEVLRQFDQDTVEPSLRRLASALKVAPSAIYHHFPSRAAIVHAAIGMVWEEATAEMLKIIDDPYTAPPDETLIACGLGTRRAWLRHHRVARHMSVTPRPSESLDESMRLMANVFERLGLGGDAAGAAFYAYASFTLGAVQFAAATIDITEEIGPGAAMPLTVPEDANASAETRQALDAAMGESLSPQGDAGEALFVASLRYLIVGFAAS